MSAEDAVIAVERACEALLAEGQPITFKGVAARAGLSRTTLYRREDLKALVDDHRERSRDATTLSRLTAQIDQLRHGLEAVAAKARGHEERLRRLERTSRQRD